MSLKVDIVFTLNSAAERASVSADASALAVLREQFDLAGAKLACGEGECGACTIIVDGISLNGCLMPAVDLTFLAVWLEQVIVELKPKVKPLIYITQKHWLEIQSGPNAEIVSRRILAQANLLSSQYNVSLPVTPLYVDRLKYWEYENGKMQYDEYGKFEAVNVPTPPPPSGDELPLVHSCPYCGKQETPIIYTCGYCGKKVKIF